MQNLYAYYKPGPWAIKGISMFKFNLVNFAGLNIPIILEAVMQFSLSKTLTSLEGSPLKTLEYQSSTISVQTLKGAPIYVKGNFFCNHNPYLTSFEGGPIYVGGNFYGHGIPSITSLKGLPAYISGDFFCDAPLYYGEDKANDKAYKDRIQQDLLKVGTVVGGNIIICRP